MTTRVAAAVGTFALVAACATPAPVRAPIAVPAPAPESPPATDSPAVLQFEAPAARPGGDSARDLDRVIRERAPSLKSCYVQQLLRRPGLTGRATISLTIGANGRVTDAATTGFDDEVDRCLTAVLRSLQFPAGDGTTKVVYPLSFAPGPP